MPRSPPARRLKLYDMRHGDREPTPASQSPSSYESSEEDSNSDSNDEKKKCPKDPEEPRYKFPEKASQNNPFPYGLPHANHYGAIRPRPLYEDDAITLDPAPETPNWRPVDNGWFAGNYMGPIVVDSNDDADDEEDEKETEGEGERMRKGKKRTRSGSDSPRSRQENGHGSYMSRY